MGWNDIGDVYYQCCLDRNERQISLGRDPHSRSLLERASPALSPDCARGSYDLLSYRFWRALPACGNHPIGRLSPPASGAPRMSALQDLASLDRVIHEPVRLMVMTV